LISILNILVKMKKKGEIPETKEIKVILLGDSIVGKTSMLMRYMKKDISEFHVATIGVERYSKVMKIKNSKDKVKLTIIDTSGQERYMSITKNYYKQANGVILIYDITNKETFKNLEFWINEIENNAIENIPIFLVGNKKDLEQNREVQSEEGKRFAEAHKCIFFETSIKEDKEIKLLFIKILENICNVKKVFKYNIIEEEDMKSYKLSRKLTQKRAKKGCC